jgi:DNA-binding transcriptional ArsR family regulator
MPQSPPSPPYPAHRAALRVLAHPVRARVLAEVRAQGAATATSVAAALATNTGATSYHLRRLADAEMIEEAGGGTGRSRVWRVTVSPPRPPEPTPGPADPDEAAISQWLARDYVEHFAGKAQAWITSSGGWPPRWQAGCGLADHLVLITDEQLSALRGELDEVLARYRRAGAGNPTAKRVAVYLCPLPVDPPPARPARG